MLIIRKTSDDLLKNTGIMEHYPEYKTSGVVWIGKIPIHWKILPFMHCLKKVKAKKKTSIPKMDYQESGQFPVIDQGASFIAGWTDLTDSVISDNLPIVIFGDHTRIFKYVDFPFTLGADGTQLLYPKDDILNPRFFYFALLNLKIPNKGYSRHYRYLREFSVACPALSTQSQIAAFLDRKTGQIDELLRVKERKIELLREQRTALINQAVTKGLDPNVEMKPSGVEWLDEIPSNWGTVKFHHLSQESRRNNDDDVDREMLSLSSYTGVQVKQYEYENTKRTKEESLTYLVVEPNQLVVNPMWQIQRGIGVSFLHGIVSPGYRVYYIDLERFVPEYLHYLMRSDIYVDEYNKHIRGLTTYDRSVRKEDFEEIVILIPSKQQQTQIAAFLDRKTKQIDELVSEEQRIIELLKEYRQSLISDAVTGKIDVRNEV